MHHEVTTELFKQIPTMKYKPLNNDKNNQFLFIYIGGLWNTKEINNKLLPLKILNPITKAEEKDYKI